MALLYPDAAKLTLRQRVSSGHLVLVGCRSADSFQLATEISNDLDRLSAGKSQKVLNLSRRGRAD
jgi:hypothetical protein